MQNSKTCNTFFSYNDVCNQLVKFHGDPLYLKILPYSPAMSGLKAKFQRFFWERHAE